jgi:tripeptidyl-peptidase-1
MLFRSICLRVAAESIYFYFHFRSGMATGVPIQFLTVGSERTHPGFAMALLDTTTYLDGIADPPTVLTTSYTDTESVVGSSLATSVVSLIV